MNPANPPMQLKLQLYHPGMSSLHRAGLGGLAATLKRLESDVKDGLWSPEKAPGWPWRNEDGKSLPPWSVSQTEVILDFGRPEAAAVFLRALFEYAFQIKDGLIFMPGAYGKTIPTLPVRAQLQEGLCCTFLQHGQSRSLDKVVVSVVDSGESLPIAVNYKPCSWYKHQDLWKEVVSDRAGTCEHRPIDLSGPLYPGASVRHVAYSALTGASEFIQTFLPLCFAPIGSLSLTVRNRIGILIIPDVVDLTKFARCIPEFTPLKSAQCQVSKASDAVLQAYIRLRSAQVVEITELPKCSAYELNVLAWSKQQKSRALGLQLIPGNETWLGQFEMALANFPVRLVTPKAKPIKTGKRKAADDPENSRTFWADSILRPFIADNLALHRPWYAGFKTLMVDQGDDGKPLRDKIAYEKKGLQKMINEIKWSSEAEETLVRAVHQAMRCRYGQIAEENSGKRDAMNNRFDREYEKWRIAFSGAKTADQFRTSLCDLFSRARQNKVLAESWRVLLPLLTQKEWQLVRDLSLLALASYSNPNSADPIKKSTDNPSQQ